MELCTEGVKGATADFVCFHCPLVASGSYYVEEGFPPLRESCAKRSRFKQLWLEG